MEELGFQKIDINEIKKEEVIAEAKWAGLQHCEAYKKTKNNTTVSVVVITVLNFAPYYAVTWLHNYNYEYAIIDNYEDFLILHNKLFKEN